MDASSYNILLFLIFQFCLNMFDIVNGKLCYKTIGKSITDGHNPVYNKKFFCCDNSEHKDNECIECKTGFLSLHGEPCKPCPTYSFGRKCHGACKCNMYESCNNVLGCITIRTEKTVTEITGHTDKEETTYKDGVKAKETTTNNVSVSSKSTKTLHEDNFAGNCRAEFKIVISGAIGLFMGVGVSIIFMVLKQIIQKRRDSAVVETNISLEIQMETLNNYEEIDDIILISHDTYINQNEENSDTSRSSIDIDYRNQNDNNADYLNPYQPIIPITDNHLYKTMRTSADIDTTDQDIAAVDSSLSSVDDDEQNNCTDKKDSSSCILQRINYAELKLCTTDKYENPRIVSILPTKDQPIHKTQYAEIVQTV